MLVVYFWTLILWMLIIFLPLLATPIYMIARPPVTMMGRPAVTAADTDGRAGAADIRYILGRGHLQGPARRSSKTGRNPGADVPFRSSSPGSRRSARTTRHGCIARES